MLQSFLLRPTPLAHDKVMDLDAQPMQGVGGLAAMRGHSSAADVHAAKESWVIGHEFIEPGECGHIENAQVGLSAVARSGDDVAEAIAVHVRDRHANPA